MPLAQALTRMAAAAKKFNLESVSNADLAWVADESASDEEGTIGNSMSASA